MLFDWVIDLFFPRDFVVIANSQAPTLSQLVDADPVVDASVPQPVSESEGGPNP